MKGEQKLPRGWAEATFSDLVTQLSTSGKKVKQRDYLPIGEIPVIDQGSGLIGGYTDDESLCIDHSSPVVVFGDHTRAFKFVNFDFAPGADGIKVLLPSQAFEAKMFYYFCRAIILPNKGYARHYQHLAKALIHVPL